MDIIIVNDAVLENDETFAVRLSSPDEDVTVGSQDATVTVSDDDGMQIECCNYAWTFFSLVCTLVGIVIPGFSQASFEVDEGTNLELCVNVSSASLERSVVLSLTTVEATAQGIQLELPLYTVDFKIHALFQPLESFLISLL